MSVKSRILQFQQNTPQSQSLLQSSQQSFASGNGNLNNHVGLINTNTNCTNNISPTRKDHSSINNNCLSKISSPSHFSSNNIAYNNNFNGSNTNGHKNGSVLGPPFQSSHSANAGSGVLSSCTGGYGAPKSDLSESISNSNSTRHSRTSEVHPNTNSSSSSLLAHSSKGRSANTEAIMSASHHQNPPVNRATKPNLMTKKASMTINLSSNSTTATTAGGGGTSSAEVSGIGSSTIANSNSSSVSSNTSQLRPKFGRSPSTNRTLPSPSSAIPKPFGSMASNHLGSNGSLNNSSSTGTSGTAGRKSPGKTTPLSSPSKSTLSDFASTGGIGGGGTPFGFGSSSGNGRLYGGLGWKEKFEDSEKKRNHLVTLAHKGN